MANKPIFEGLIVDENGNPVEAAYVGDEPFYIVNDAGFRRHIPSEQVDRQVLNFMKEQIQGNEGLISEQTAKMLGEDDIFARAVIENQLKQIEHQFELLLQTGFPEESRAYMGMMGFQVVINIHGEVLKINQPGAAGPEDE